MTTVRAVHVPTTAGSSAALVSVANVRRRVTAHAVPITATTVGSSAALVERDVRHAAMGIRVRRAVRVTVMIVRAVRVPKGKAVSARHREIVHAVHITARVARVAHRAATGIRVRRVVTAIVTTAHAVRVRKGIAANVRHRVTVRAVPLTAKGAAIRVRRVVTATHVLHAGKVIGMTVGRAPAQHAALAKGVLRAVTATRARHVERAVSAPHQVTVRAVPPEIVQQGAAAVVSVMDGQRVQARAATVPQAARDAVRLPAAMGIAATVRRVRPASARTRNN